jgi:predicted RNA-binding protein with PIN domain
MVYILIDGYNLIGIAHGNLEKERNDIIEKLSRYSSVKGHNITLVFDGWKGGQLTETKQNIKNITVIYSRAGEKADTVIKRFVKEDKRPWIVVSSDREISDFAYKKDCLPVTSDEFEDKLISCLRLSGSEGTGEYREDMEEELDRIPVLSRGNPRKLSRKQKKRLQALDKL